MRILTQLILISLLLSSCNSTKYTPLDYPDDTISFGTGGGIANLTTEYTLLSDGSLFKKSSTSEYELLMKVNKNQKDQLFSNINFLNLLDVQHSDPGNMTSFLRLKIGDRKNDISWGGGNSPIPPDVQLFYQTLNTLLNTQN